MTLLLCTLFDRHYLTRGLALYRSLCDLGIAFELRVFAMDHETADILTQLDLPSIVVTSLEELERHDVGLAGTKTDRTQVEYCWTATPAVCRYVLETQPEVDEITYVDADVCFFSDPAMLLEEMGDASVMIVPHRYAPVYAGMEATSGTYNVEWLTFRRDERGLAALHWWHARCIEWCYFRHEDGKLGDQKYLDDWPDRFAGVHVLQHPGGGLAPWNVTSHALLAADGAPLVDGRPLVFYHHHSLRVYERSLSSRLGVATSLLRAGEGTLGRPWTLNYPVGDDELDLVWRPYLRRLDAASEEVRRAVPGFCADALAYPIQSAARRIVRAVARRVVQHVRTAWEVADPARWAPGASRRYIGSWRSQNVAQQMLALTDRELASPDGSPPYRAFRTLLMSLVSNPELPPEATLIDVGCGIGAYGELVNRWVPGRFRYVGIEDSAPIRAEAERRWPRRSFRAGSLFDPGITDGADVVLASAVIDILPNWREGLEALLGCDARWVILHRQRVTAGRSRTEPTQGYRGQRTYRSTVNRDELDQLVRASGRRETARVVVDGTVESFVFERCGRC